MMIIVVYLCNIPQHIIEHFLLANEHIATLFNIGVIDTLIIVVMVVVFFEGWLSFLLELMILFHDFANIGIEKLL